MTLLADTALPFNAPSFAYAKLQALMYCDTVAGDDALVIVHNSGQTTVLSDAVTIGEADATQDKWRGRCKTKQRGVTLPPVRAGA